MVTSKVTIHSIEQMPVFLFPEGTTPPFSPPEWPVQSRISRENCPTAGPVIFARRGESKSSAYYAKDGTRLQS